MTAAGIIRFLLPAIRPRHCLTSATNRELARKRLSPANPAPLIPSL